MNGTTESIQIQINGDLLPVAAGQGLMDLVACLGLPPKGVLIEYNGLALLRDEWDRTRLSQGDRLEILRIVAGG